MKFKEGLRNLHENGFEDYKRNLRFALMKWKKMLHFENSMCFYYLSLKRIMFYFKDLVSCFWYVIFIQILGYC